MALQIWCPFTTDFRNLGIIGELNKSGSPSITSDGKLGNCITNSNGYFTFPQTAFPASTGFTCCAWVYITNLNKTNGLVSNTESGPVYSGCLISNGKLDYWHYNNGWLNSYGNTTLSANTWYHVAFVILGTTVKFYVNGEPDGELDGTTGSNNYLNVICKSFYGSSEFTGKINDLRVYDHELTPLEIKEISKGLVCHYTLGSASVYEATTNVGSNAWQTYEPYWNNLSGSYGNWQLTKNSGSQTLAITNSTISSVMSAGLTWALSGYLYKNGVPYKTSISNPSTYSGYSIQSWESRDDGYFRYTMYINSVPGWLIHSEMFGNDNTQGSVVQIRCLQFELKDHATPYTSSSRSTGLVYDSSGFGRNLIITGNILPSDSVRYDRAVYLPNQNANANYLSANGWSPQSFLTTCSISFWCKFNGLGSAGWLPFIGLSGSYYVMAWNNGGNFYHENSGSGTKTIYRDGAVVTAPSDNGNWHHYVITGIDLSSWTNFKINQYGNSWDSNMYISDIRIYNTVLTLLDAKDLYSLGATIS